MEQNGILINIQNPCKQKFEEMAVAGEGRYCNSCAKTVFDFSLLTDLELQNFFNAHSGSVCGKFHISQLDRIISPSNPKQGIKKRFQAIAASIATFFALNGSPLKASVPSNSFSIIETAFNKKIRLFSDTIIFKGFILDKDNRPIENAEVLFLNGKDSLKVKSDFDGKFYMVFTGKVKTTSSLIFTYLNLKTILIINADFLTNSENIFVRLQEENCPPIPVGLTGRMGGLVIQKIPPRPLTMIDWLRRL